jgi:surface protein
VEITGAFASTYSLSPALATTHKTKLRSIDQWGTIGWTSMENAFNGCTNLVVTATDAPDLSGVTSLKGMFRETGLTTENFNHWDVSTITNMYETFAYCPNFNGEISEWEVDNVTNMTYMFRCLSYYENPFAGDLSGWNIGQVTSMSSMLDYSGLSQESVDAMLLAWSQLPVLQENVSLGLAGLNYCDYVGKEALTDDHGWTITGLTSKCPQELSFDPFPEMTYGISDSNIPLVFSNSSGLAPTTVTSSDTDVATIVEYPQYTYKVVIVGPGTTTISAQTEEGVSYFASNVATQELVVNEMRPFITKWNIENTGASGWNTLQMAPLYSSQGYTVDWGDGETYQGTYAGTHTYAAEGEYSVKVTGDFTYFTARASDRAKLIEISQWGDIQWNTFWGSFQYCANVTYAATDAPDLSGVSDLRSMFSSATSFDGDISNWDMSGITNLSGIFDYSGLSPDNYDLILDGWAASASLQSNVSMSAYGVTYCSAGDARQSLMNNYNWTISDDGQLCAPIAWNGSSWSNGTGPTATDNAEINGDYNETAGFECDKLTVAWGNSLTVNSTLIVNGDITNDGTMVVESGASLITYDGNTISDNITFRRNTRYADGRYSFIGSPVEYNVYVTGENLGSHVYRYDESASSNTNALTRWIDATYDVLTPSKGYTQAEQQLIQLTGRPNDGDVVRGVSYVNDGWNLVSNPYPAALDIDAFIDGNGYLTGNVYIWDDNGSDTGRGSNSDYIVANKSGATDNNGVDSESRWNGHIGSMQGFFVQLNGQSGNILFRESMRVSGNNADANFFRKTDSQPSRVRVNLTHKDGLFKQALVAWNPSVSDDVLTHGYDAKVFNADASYAIYTVKADEALAIQTITFEKETVPLAYRVEEAGTYTIALDHQEAHGQFLYLKDNLTGEVVDATGGYEFTTQAGLYSDRFVLTTTANVLALDNLKSQIYAVNKIVYIKSQESQATTYRLYDLLGHQVHMAVISGPAELDLSALPVGIYMVSDGIETKKIILK